MSTETGADPYDAVLADIEAQIERLQTAKAAIQSIRGHRPSTGGDVPQRAAPAKAAIPSIDALGPGAFLGMTIVDATKKLLRAKREALNNPAIAGALKAGGLVLRSDDTINTIGAVLTRRYKDVGDIVKVGRGTWGLREWYPHTSFRRKEDGSAADREIIREKPSVADEVPTEEADASSSVRDTPENLAG